MISKSSANKTALKSRLGVVLFLIFLSLLACSPALAGDKETYIKQSHKIHTQDEELGCGDCHDMEAESIIPKKEICADCHEEVEDEDNKEGCLFCHDVALEKLPDLENLKVVMGSEKFKNINFSHNLHMEKELECLECHGEIAKESRIPFPRGKYIPEVSQCLDCHIKTIDKFVISDWCEKCHAPGGYSKSAKPNSHRAGWTRRHGLFAETDIVDEKHGASCLTCHSKNDCVECHKSTLPRDHTNFWRTRGHGIMASVDRDRCLNCHRQDTCVSCHNETAPRSHKGSWGRIGQDHCKECHMESCSVCHRIPAHMGDK